MLGFSEASKLLLAIPYYQVLFNFVSAKIPGKQRILTKYFVDEINYKNLIKIIKTTALYVSRTARYCLCGRV